ncbi:MAG: PsiF family protein [Burkholderiales bacterium]
MRIRAILIGMAVAFSAHAQEKKETAKPPTAQQQRMADCNKQASAKGLKGDERKGFMSSCLKDKPQDRMAKCNTEAGGKKMKGDARKKFMSECLKA